ncbi:MAG: isoprenylcysteine carboxylmethyltransferase family protein [Candidatus Omnitrophota bacterium]
MKKRIKIDSSILSFIIILTGLLYQFPHLYTYSLRTDDAFDLLGLIIVFWGTFLRMAARGYKKVYSQKGHGLVISGPYALTRNPMYLGSFLMGAGFILIVWPWWTLILFAVLFYIRFNKQIKKEEKHLEALFGPDYHRYAQKVPRVFPSWRHVRKIHFQKTFPFESSWNTKEKWGLAGWFALAVILEVLQEKIIYGLLDISHALIIFLFSALIFAASLWVLYKHE